MSGGSGAALSQEDEGTILMLCLSLGLAIIAVVYFLCRWTKKQNIKRQEAILRTQKSNSIRKDRVKQTFSRFSQVDDELTVHIDHDDQELLQSFQQAARSSVQPKHFAPHSVNVASGMPPSNTPVNVKNTSERTLSSGKPYLETDI